MVKVLMLSGANASLRTRGGALPYHLAGLQIVRTMLQDMGGPEVVPEIGDTIDMVAILRELTMSDVYYDDNNRGTLLSCHKKVLCLIILIFFWLVLDEIIYRFLPLSHFIVPTF